MGDGSDYFRWCLIGVVDQSDCLKFSKVLIVPSPPALIFFGKDNTVSTVSGLLANW